MNNRKFYITGQSDALHFTNAVLQENGYTVSQAPDKSVTHLLLPVPSFDPTGNIKGGKPLTDILQQLPKNITIIGGQLTHPALAGYNTIDLLEDPIYVAENANITAHCAIRLAMAQLPITLRGCQVLIIGWGRIGKCLATLLKDLGAQVLVAARKEADRAMLGALGYHAIDFATLASALPHCRVVFNTAPYMVLPEALVQHCSSQCLKIDLASVKGIDGNDVLWARGLPGKDVPETSGALIAHTVIRIIDGKEFTI